MAKKSRAHTEPNRNGTQTRDKFRIGQQVALVLHVDSGWQRANGELGVVVGPKVLGTFKCCALGASKAVDVQTGERYAVRWKDGVSNFDEDQLRAIYEGEQMSTWDELTKLTGLRINVPEAIRD